MRRVTHAVSRAVSVAKSVAPRISVSRHRSRASLSLFGEDDAQQGPAGTSQREAAQVRAGPAYIACIGRCQVLRLTVWEAQCRVPKQEWRLPCCLWQQPC